MSIDALELSLYDLYVMDSWDCSEKSSYLRWTVSELLHYISVRLSPRKTGSKKELHAITYEFAEKMIQYSKLNTEHNRQFQVAYQLAYEILDLFHDI